MNAPLMQRLVPVVVGTSLLLVADLFLSWQKVEIEVGGAAVVEATSSGWSGWGIVAGLAAAVLAGLHLSHSDGDVSPIAAGVIAAASCCVAGASALAVFTGSASIATASVGVEVGTTLWPAWVGLGLALGTAGAALAPLAAAGERARLIAPRAS